MAPPRESCVGVPASLRVARGGRVLALALLLSGTLATAGLLAGCGEESTSRASARDMATTATCDYWMRCDQIGAGKMFETRDTCMVRTRATFEDAWPPSACEGKILKEPLRICLQQISVAACGSALDFLSALDKCQRSRVCATPAPTM